MKTPQNNNNIKYSHSSVKKNKKIHRMYVNKKKEKKDAPKHFEFAIYNFKLYEWCCQPPDIAIYNFFFFVLLFGWRGVTQAIVKTFSSHSTSLYYYYHHQLCLHEKEKFAYFGVNSHRWQCNMRSSMNLYVTLIALCCDTVILCGIEIFCFSVVCQGHEIVII